MLMWSVSRIIRAVHVAVKLVIRDTTYDPTCMVLSLIGVANSLGTYEHPD